MFQKNVPRVTAKPLIAIIEDDESLRPALGGLVRSLGYDGAEFDTAEAFLSSDVRLHANCLVTDFQLPGLSGMDLASKFRGLLPVIIITARMERSLDALAVKNGVRCLLHKPFEADELAACIRRALDSSPGSAQQGNP